MMARLQTQSGDRQAHAIGTVKGPGETGNQYVFITADTQNIKIGEFVYFYLPNPDGRGWLEILGKISACSLVDHLPDRIFADTEIDPSAIAAL
ncbi:MAG: ATPase, partial [Cyanobacteria bacterium P01_F01_bin.42]